ncbi:MAG: ATP-binding protein, partial [Bifidobacteriaceae bacterium]|nr:ATP-binding protein [Bifidobacteriaceae bacterium]
DTETAQLFITGSSSALLSSEIATQFRGRSRAYELLPFSFAEYARANGEPPEWDGSAAARSRLEALFDAYLVEGGFPGLRGLPAQDRIGVLQDYASLVVVRDLLDRYDIPDARGVRDVADALLAANGTALSVNRLTARLKARGMAIGRDRVTAMARHLADAYLLFFVPVFTYSGHKSRVNPQKVYAIDPGLAFAVSAAPSVNLGQRLEQAVYLELRRRHPLARERGISYYLTRDRREVDFVVGDRGQGQAAALVQVCADLRDAQTRGREITALETAMGELGLDQGTIVTLRDSETIKVEAGTIEAVPAWRWCLEM